MRTSALKNLHLWHLISHLFVASQVTDFGGSGLVGYRCPLLLRRCRCARRVSRGAAPRAPRDRADWCFVSNSRRKKGQATKACPLYLICDLEGLSCRRLPRHRRPRRRRQRRRYRLPNHCRRRSERDRWRERASPWACSRLTGSRQGPATRITFSS